MRLCVLAWRSPRTVLNVVQPEVRGISYLSDQGSVCPELFVHEQEEHLCTFATARPAGWVVQGVVGS